ncbi:MAG: hypothetical protein WCP45_11200 [Verrucomicrobiota bacterium]
MRVPLSLSIILALVVPLGIWWLCTRKMDFLTPPTEARLAIIRQKTEASLPHQEIQPPKAAPKAPPPPVAAPIPSPPPPVEPGVEIGELKPNPGLDTYSELGSKGARYLIELASLLETSGELAHSVLAWERVLDSTTPDPSQANTARAAIQRLRPKLPVWNSNPAKAIPIVLRASIASDLDKSIKPILEQAAKDLGRASSGILKVTTKITSTSKSAPAAVDLWLTGGTAKAPVTETLSFTVTKPKNLPTDILRKLFRLTSKQLGKVRPLAPIPAPAANDPPLNALETRITRLCWQQFGLSLNKAPATR